MLASPFRRLAIERVFGGPILFTKVDSGTNGAARLCLMANCRLSPNREPMASISFIYFGLTWSDKQQPAMLLKAAACRLQRASLSKTAKVSDNLVSETAYPVIRNTVDPSSAEFKVGAGSHGVK